MHFFDTKATHPARSGRAPGMKNSSRLSVVLLILWHLLAMAALALVLPELKFKLPVWSLKAAELRPLELMLGAYALCALLSVAVRRRGEPLRITGLATLTVAVFGLLFLYFLITRVDSARIIMGQMLLATLVLVPLGRRLSGAWRGAGVLVLGAAVVAGVLISRPGSDKPGAAHPETNSMLLRTAFYNVRATSYLDQIPEPAVRGGGLARLGDRFVLATGDGHLYLFDWRRDGAGGKPQFRALPFRVPINGDEFAHDNGGGPWHKPAEGDAQSVMGEDTGSTVITWWFRVNSPLVQELGDQMRLFVSHYFWKPEHSCWVERVSMLEMPRTAFEAGTPGASWQTLFETTPCLPIKGEGRRRGTPFAGHFGGGRMIQMDPDTVLLTVGDFGFNGVSSKQMVSQDPSVSYGKTILLHVKEKRSEMYTLGNRNPQGLYRDSEGRIWDTEHGPQGGDELNLLKPGLNYGWPIVTYGVDYGTFGWPLNPHPGDHLGFEAPFFAWLPSIGVSNLTGVTRELFPVWKGDLLVSSLVNQHVYRVRIRNDRVVYAEPMMLEKRIRDITEAGDGTIVMWADDDNAIVTLRPEFGNSGEVAFATSCSGCHKVGDGTSHRIGPDLWGVIGRKPGSAEGYSDYSAAMRSRGGEWTEARLNAFIEHPQATVPGTAMEFAGIADAKTRERIIDYLKHAPKVVSR